MVHKKECVHSDGALVDPPLHSTIFLSFFGHHSIFYSSILLSPILPLVLLGTWLGLEIGRGCRPWFRGAKPHPKGNLTLTLTSPQTSPPPLHNRQGEGRRSSCVRQSSACSRATSSPPRFVSRVGEGGYSHAGIRGIPKMGREYFNRFEQIGILWTQPGWEEPSSHRLPKGGGSGKKKETWSPRSCARAVACASCPSTLPWAARSIGGGGGGENPSSSRRVRGISFDNHPPPLGGGHGISRISNGRYQWYPCVKRW